MVREYSSLRWEQDSMKSEEQKKQSAKAAVAAESRQDRIAELDAKGNNCLPRL